MEGEVLMDRISITNHRNHQNQKSPVTNCAEEERKNEMEKTPAIIIIWIFCQARKEPKKNPEGSWIFQNARASVYYSAILIVVCADILRYFSFSPKRSSALVLGG